MVSEFGRYAVTLRCANSLPEPILEQIKAIHNAQKTIPTQSSEMEKLQRKLFFTLEKYSDLGRGFAPFKHPLAARAMNTFLHRYSRAELRFSDWTIMPNHIHLLTHGVAFDSVESFLQAWRSLKGESGREMNQLLKRSGGFWQVEWYDRLIRDEVEYRKWKCYLAENPVKANLSTTPSKYPYTFIS